MPAVLPSDSPPWRHVHSWAAARDPTTPRQRSPGSKPRCGCPRDTEGEGRDMRCDPPVAGTAAEAQRGDCPGRASTARGTHGRRGSQPVPTGGDECRRVQLNAVTSRLFLRCCCCGCSRTTFPPHNMPRGQTQPPRRFPSAATFKRTSSLMYSLR